MRKLGLLALFCFVFLSCEKREVVQGRHGRSITVEKRIPQHVEVVSGKKDVDTAKVVSQNKDSITTSSNKAPVSPEILKVHQKDGTDLDVIGTGNRAVPYTETTDGYTLVYNSSGIYEYAVINDSGDLVPSGIKARNPGHRSKYELKFLEEHPKHLKYSGKKLEEMIQKNKEREKVD